MGKRTAFEASGRPAVEAPAVKRQRIERVEGSSQRTPPPVEDVHNARQLQQALQFQRGAVEAFRSGISIPHTLYML